MHTTFVLSTARRRRIQGLMRIRAFFSAGVSFDSSSVGVRPEPYFRSSPIIASWSSGGSCSVENILHGGWFPTGIDIPVSRSISRISCRVISRPRIRAAVTSRVRPINIAPLGYSAWNRSPTPSSPSAILWPVVMRTFVDRAFLAGKLVEVVFGCSRS